jgi:L-ascorbate metabolism protein UlaG (beta-lactamase superfamily)
VARFPVSDHCDGERFFNVDRSADRSLADVIRWMRTRVRTPWPQTLAVDSYPPPPISVPHGRIAVTSIGHSTFLIRTASAVLLTDPVFTSHAGPFGRFGPRRVRPPGIASSSLPPIDLVLVSHNHYDHLQPGSLQRFHETASFVAPLGVTPQLRLPPDQPSASAASGFKRIHELDWWQTTRVGEAQITAVPAQHFSARTPWDRNRTLWCGYVVQIDGLTVYFAGDTGYAPHFRQIAARFPRIDVALLPIGAYEPRWFMIYAHMNPEEAVRAHVDLHARVSIGMHFGTFHLTDEAIDAPLRALEQSRQAHGVAADAFRVPGCGETLTL